MLDIGRREFITLLGGAAAPVDRASEQDQRVGVLMPRRAFGSCTNSVMTSRSSWSRIFPMGDKPKIKPSPFLQDLKFHRDSYSPALGQQANSQLLHLRCSTIRLVFVALLPLSADR